MRTLKYNFMNVANLATRERYFAKLASGNTMPTYREIQLAVNLEADELHDRLASLPGFSASRVDNEHSYLESAIDLVQVISVKRNRYTSLHLRLWTASALRAKEVRLTLEKVIEDVAIHDAMFTIDWHFATSRGLGSSHVDEIANDKLVDAAYPSITEGVYPFINRYLASDLAVLVVHGPPGTGKTKLIRAILGEMARRSPDDCLVMFTADDKLLHEDELFLRFVSGGHKAFVVEDADHILKSRKDGNKSMHRFLTISDGIVRAQGRKIIFSSNLPNLGDIDEALLRPGRCFASLTLPRLQPSEVKALLPALQSDDIKVTSARDTLLSKGAKSISLAEIYQELAMLDAQPV